MGGICTAFPMPVATAPFPGTEVSTYFLLMPETPLEYYSRRLAESGNAVSCLGRTERMLSRARLISFVAALGSGYLLSRAGFVPAALVSAVGLLTVFFFLVSRTRQVRRLIDHHRRIGMVNKRGESRILGVWSDYSDTGELFLDRDHHYSFDLDIFGCHSLYQWVSAAHTSTGKRLLGRTLTEIESDRDQIRQTQEAVDELSRDIPWLQELQAHAMRSENLPDPQGISDWLRDGRVIFSSIWMPAVVTILSVLPLLGLLLIPITGFAHLFPVALAVNILVYALVMHRTGPVLAMVEKHSPGLEPYEALLRHIEDRPCTSPALTTLKASLIGPAAASASRQLSRLRRLAPWVEIRHSPMAAVILNALFLWDLHAIRIIEKWKKDHGARFETWLQVIGRMEVLAGFAAIRFENPAWAFPRFSDGQCSIQARNLGHPLIHDSKRVGNDLTLTTSGSVLILTGSNMSGKTTLLRTVGINYVMSCCGAPVCADEMVCSMMNVWTSMRLFDDLERGISTFYAQLLRIRNILDDAKKGPVLALIDEIFGGTNSRDRTTAAVAVMKKLSMVNALTIMSTHDLALEELSNNDPQRFISAHFQEHYTGDRIHFDYRLRPGPARTTNALHLLRAVGLES